MKQLFTFFRLFMITTISWVPFQAPANETVSSISDTDTYRGFCLKAATDEATFNNFKRNRGYQQILEHLSFKHGKSHLKYIKDHYPHLLAHWPKFSENDRLGNPVTFKFSKLGKASPTTIRYVKILGDLEKHFGSLDDKKILEIGGGYGGQCKIVCDVYSPEQYTIVDLIEPLMLTEKYLSKLKVSENHTIHFHSPEEISPEVFDVCISNYAFSECSKECQQEYLEKYLLRSSAGYMLYNKLSSSLTIYSIEEIREMFIQSGYDVTITREDPLTSPNNKLMIWHKI